MPWPAMALALVVAAASLGNGFAYDDLRLLVENERVTLLQAPWEYLNQSYWPAGGLYRPLTVWLMALLWKAGGGVPWIFHLTIVALHGLATGLVYLSGAAHARLRRGLQLVHSSSPCTRFMSRRWPTSWGSPKSSALCWSLACVLLGLRAVEDRLNPRSRLGVIALGVLASLSKEQGFVTPALLLATAGLVDPLHRMRSLRKVLPVVVALALVLASLVLFRAAVLGGLAGDDPAAPLRGLSTRARLLVSLGTVPEWLRLLVWPARLSFDYSPPGHAVAATPGLVHVVAALLIAVAVWLAWVCRTVTPAVTLGVVWIGIALLPVSNLLLPTGILLAERTLYLPSVGAVLALGGVAERMSRWLPSATARRVAVGVMVVLLLVAGAHSALRARVWKDNASLLRQVEREAPSNYRAHRTLALYLDRQGRLDDAAREYRRSIALWGGDPTGVREPGHPARSAGQ